MTIISKYQNIIAKDSLLDTVYSMRYVAYLGNNSIEESSSKRFMDEYDTMPNCTSYLTYFRNKPIGSIRSCIYNPELEIPIPAMDVFAKEIESTIGYSDIFVESNKFVIEPSYQRKNSPRLLFNIFRNIIVSAQETNAKYIITAVRENHIKFYNNLYFEAVSEAKPYSHLNFQTVLMICYDIKLCTQRVFRIAVEK